MRSVVQRVKNAEVSVDGKVIASISEGLVVLVGFRTSDEVRDMEYILDKLVGLRVFQDDEGKMNLSVVDIAGGLLIVPNFTLYGDARKGRRPSYSSGASPEEARGLFEKFIQIAKTKYCRLGFGEFQAEMLLSLVNDGPVTILLDSTKLF